MAGRILHQAYLLMGGNMGDRKSYLNQALNELIKNCGPVIETSALYETEAWGLENQEKFLNQVVLIETKLPAEKLLFEILRIEENLGRKREMKYGPRIIDIDILLFNDEVMHSSGLTIPHPQLQNRRFALVPLEEIAAHKIHPVLKKTITELLNDCTDNLNVNKIV